MDEKQDLKNELSTSFTDSNTSITIPSLNELPDEAKGEVTSKMIELQNHREQRQVELLKLKLEYEERDKQRSFEARQKELDREERELANRDAREERREDRDFHAAENARDREHDSSEKGKDRAAEEAKNIRNNRGSVLSNLNFKNIAVGLAILAIVVCGIFFFLEMNGRIYAPDDSNELKKESVNNACRRFEEAGFAKVETVPNYDPTYKGTNGKIKEITIKGRDDFKKTDKFSPKDKVSIHYYETGSAHPPYSSKDVQKVQKEIVKNNFVDYGFERIKMISSNEPDFQDGMVISVTINGEDNYTTQYVFDKKSEVIITYKEEKPCLIPNTNNGFAKTNLDDALDAIKRAGFIDVTVKASYDATNKNKGRVSSITIDGKTDYKKNSEHPRNCEIIITYHALPQEKDLKDNEAMIPYSSKDMKGKNYEDLQKELETVGFKNIKTEPTYDASNGFVVGIGKNIGEVISVTISDKDDFEQYTIFKKDSPIEIQYHEDKDVKPLEEGYTKVPGKSSSYNKKNYSEVVQAFTDAGFKNITTEAVPGSSNLLSALNRYKANQTIEVEIDGKNSFSENDSFKNDANVIVRYRSQKNE